MDFYLGIDIGTSRVKAVLFDEHFQARASAAENTGPRLSANGHAEQDMAGTSPDSWHSRIENAGLTCKPVLKGTVEYADFAEIWLMHLARAMEALTAARNPEEEKNRPGA